MNPDRAFGASPSAVGRLDSTQGFGREYYFGGIAKR
jgi:hypothetical protein